MMRLVLSSNNFCLNDNEHYLQLEGTAIGSKLGRNYACTYMGAWETKLHEQSELKPLVYLRYIDDIFGIWLHGQQSLEEYHALANSIHPNIKVDLRMSCSSIDFLDVTVNLHNGFLATDLYTKPTDSNNYLHFSSDHPIHVKRAVPLNLAMRLKRICSSHADYVKHKKDLKTRLLARGYPESIINTSFRKADKTDRTQLLKNKARTVKKVDRVPMVVTFSSHLPDINMILNKKRHILHQSDRLKNIFPENSMVAYRRGRNLQDMLVHAKTNRKNDEGNQREFKTVAKSA